MNRTLDEENKALIDQNNKLILQVYLLMDLSKNEEYKKRQNHSIFLSLSYY